MKIVFLNTWGGRVEQPLINFFKNHQDVDVFCLQEVYSNAHGKDLLWEDAHLDLVTDIKNTLVDYDYIFHPSLEDWWGLAIFFKKNLSVTNHGEFFVHKQKRYNLELEKNGRTAKNVQFLTCEIGDKKLTILNFHGLWNGQGKDDTEDRLKQSENIISFLKNVDHSFILGGDFNLSPTTQSLKMFEDFGLKNLIKEYGVTSTQTSYYTKENKFADYVFVSDGIYVTDFHVIPEEVSDHAAVCYNRTMKQVIIIHGAPSKEEFFDVNGPSPSNMIWYPTIQKSLSLVGESCQTLEMPKPYNPVYQEWVAVFEQVKISNETILIGHSCGGGFLLKYFSEHPEIIPKRLILVAPWIDPFQELTEVFFDFEIDTTITDRIPVNTFLSTDDNETGMQKSFEMIKEKLPNVQYHKFDNRGHFTETEFPELLEIIL